MRYSLLLFLLLIISSACSTSKSSSTKDNAATEAKVKKQFEKILNLIQKGDYQKVAPLITYGGEDKERYCKDVCDYSIDEERNRVDDLIEETIEYLGKSPKYSYLGMMLAPESEGVWHVLKVKTTYKGKEQKVGFAFLKINGIFTYADISTDIP